MGYLLHLEIAAYILGGWVIFLIQVVPQIELNWAGVATAAACLLVLAWGLHSFLRWLYEQPAASPSGPPRLWARRWTFSLLAAVLLMFVAGMGVVGIVHQIRWLATSPVPLVKGGIREAAARTQSANNLKQIAIAAHYFHDTYKRLPAGGIFDAHGRGMHGWQTLLLPYVEQMSLFNQIKMDVPWDQPPNRKLMENRVQVYLHPMGVSAHNADGFAFSHYPGNVRVLNGTKGLVMPKDIPDGTSHTILAGEAANGFKPWGHPANWRDPAKGLLRSPDTFGSPDLTAEMTQFVMLDGSVRGFRNDISPYILRALSTPAGGENVKDDWE